jgi:hypothetical protein
VSEREVKKLNHSEKQKKSIFAIKKIKISGNIFKL